VILRAGQLVDVVDHDLHGGDVEVGAGGEASATDRVSAEHQVFALLALRTNEEGVSWTSCC